MISPLANPADAIRVPSSGGADHWTVTGGVAIPSTSPGLPTITRDSRFLVVDALTGSEADITHRITTVDLETGSAKVIAQYVGPGFANAFWDQPGEHIVVLTNTGNGQAVTIISVDTMDQHVLVGALPEGYWVLGAG